MKKELPMLENPLNAQERLLYAVALRLDRIIELLEGKETPEVKEEIITSVEEVVEAPKRRQRRKKE